jgi:hypothetical protein
MIDAGAGVAARAGACEVRVVVAVEICPKAFWFVHPFVLLVFFRQDSARLRLLVAVGIDHRHDVDLAAVEQPGRVGSRPYPRSRVATKSIADSAVATSRAWMLAIRKKRGLGPGIASLVRRTIQRS